jgi:hypothetical protein
MTDAPVLIPETREDRDEIGVETLSVMTFVLSKTLLAFETVFRNSRKIKNT